MTNKEYWAKWFKAAAIRAVRTVAQTALGVIGGSVMFSEVNWGTVASAALLAGIVSIIMSVAGLPEVDPAAKIDMQPEDLGDDEG